MKYADYQESKSTRRILPTQKWLWGLFIFGLPIASILLFMLSPSLRLWIGSFSITRLDAPYRYPFSLSLPGTVNPTVALQREIAFYQERVRRDPQGSLNLATLARAYLKMARATGESSWYLLSEQAAQRSLANMAFDNHGAVLVLARVAEARHDFAEALRLANQVQQQQPDNEDSLAIMVTANLAMGKVAAANQASEALVKQIPTLASLTLRALVKVAQGKDKEAIENFQQALAVEEPGETGSSAWARTLLGRFYYKRGNFTQASEIYREVLRILPRYPLALINLAELETRLGKYREAEKHYSQVVTYSQESSTVFDHVVLRGMAQIKDLQGDKSGAIALREKAEALLRQEATGHELGSFGHRRELAHLLLERDRPQDVAEALTLMQAEIQIRRDPETLDTLAWALSRSGRWQEAQQAIQEAMRSGIRDAGIFYRAGVIAQALGQQSQAKTYFDLAQQTDPTFDEQAQRILGFRNRSF